MTQYNNNGYGQSKPYVTPAGHQYKDGNFAAWLWGIIVFITLVCFLIYKGAQNNVWSGGTATSYAPKYERVKEYTYQVPILQYKGITNDYWKIKAEYNRQLKDKK